MKSRDGRGFGALGGNVQACVHCGKNRATEDYVTGRGTFKIHVACREELEARAKRLARERAEVLDTPIPFTLAPKAALS